MAKRQNLTAKKKIGGVEFTIYANKNHGICGLCPRPQGTEIFSHYQGRDIRLYSGKMFTELEEFFESRK